MKETVGSPGPFQPFHAFIHGVLAGMFFLPSRLETRVVGPKGQWAFYLFFSCLPCLSFSKDKGIEGQTGKT